MIEEEALFLVWGPPSHGPRSKVFARELGIDVEFIEVTKRRGLWAAPYKYPLQLLKTVRLLKQRRPRLLFVQSPPWFAVATAAVYCALVGGRYLIDAHSAALLSPLWTRPRLVNRLLFRRAVATVVTNEHFAAELEAWGARAVVLRDVPTEFVRSARIELPAGFNVMVVNTFSFDEPLEAAMEAARQVPDVTFHVTGRIPGDSRSVTAAAPSNVKFTDYLSDEDYYGLMERVDAVMCLTTRDHTMQRGACEALSMGRPIITSDSELLRAYFKQGTIHVDNSLPAIREAVERMRADHSRFLAEIQELRHSQLEQWSQAQGRLAEALKAAPVGGREKRNAG